MVCYLSHCFVEEEKKRRCNCCIKLKYPWQLLCLLWIINDVYGNCTSGLLITVWRTLRIADAIISELCCEREQREQSREMHISVMRI